MGWRMKTVLEVCLRRTIAILFVCAGLAWGAVPVAAQIIVDDDGQATAPSDCGGTAVAPSTIGAGVTAAAPGATVVVCPGTYAENVVINKSLTLEGNNAGTPGTGSRSAETLVVPGSNNVTDGVIFSVQASDVTIGGFFFDADNPGISAAPSDYEAVQGVRIDASSTTYNNVTVQNSIFDGFPNGSQGATIVPAGIFGGATGGSPVTGHVFQDNLFTQFQGYQNLGTEFASVGIAVINGFQATLTNNVSQNVAFGILMSGNGTMPTLSGGSHSGNHRGVVVYPGVIDSEYTIDGVTVSNNTEFGMVIFRFDASTRGLGDGNQDVTVTVRNSTAINTGNFSSDSAGMAVNLFTGTGQYLAFLEDNVVSNNQNRGINIRDNDFPTEVFAEVRRTTVEGNGHTPNSAPNAFGIVALRGGEVNVVNSIVSNTSSTQSAPNAEAVAAKREGVNTGDVGRVFISNSTILAPVGVQAAITGPTTDPASEAGVLDASGNWWGTNDPSAFVLGGTSPGSIDYTPFLMTGTDTDGATNGFQGDFTTLGVDSGSNQVQTASRFQEAAASGGGTSVTASTTGGALFDVESGGVDLQGDLVVATDLTFASGSGELRVPEEIVVESGVSSVTSTQTFVSQLITEGTAGTGNDTGWRQLASPRANATGADLSDDADFSTSNGSILYTFNDGSQNFVAGDNTSSTALPSGEGFFLYYFDDTQETVEPASPLTLDVAGSLDPSISSFPSMAEFGVGDVPVSLAAAPDFQDAHLLGNPYAQSFDLSSLIIDGQTLSSSSELLAVASVWDYDAGVDGEYVPITEDGASTSDQIAPWQGFFVCRSSTTSGSALSGSFQTGGRSNGAPFIPTKSLSEPVRTGRFVVDLSLEDESGTVVADSRATVYLRDGVATGLDRFDAPRLAPWAETYVQVSPLSPKGSRLLQASLPYELTDAVEVPLAVEGVGLSGTAEISVPTLDNLPASWSVVLVDRLRETEVEVHDGARYRFELSGTAAPDGLATTEGMPDLDASSRFLLKIGPADPLPVELASFDGVPNGKGGVLRWTTLSETNNDRFEIERRLQGAAGSFKTVGAVDGRGTTTELQSYTFRIDRLDYGTHEFRLRQVDADGSREIVGETSIERVLDAPADVGETAPNPLNAAATLAITVREAQSVRVTAYDALGRRVATLFDEEVTPGQTQHVPVGRLAGGASGHYFLRVEGDTFTEVRRAVVVR